MATPQSTTARLFYRAAGQRFEDATFLLELRRTTAAVYLAGYGVECILKSMILASVPRSQENATRAMFRGSRAHDYDWLLRMYRERGGPGLAPEIVPHFTRINTWSTDMRYSPGAIAMNDAKAFVNSSFEMLSWAEQRLS